LSPDAQRSRKTRPDLCVEVAIPSSLDSQESADVSARPGIALAHISGDPSMTSTVSKILLLVALLLMVSPVVHSDDDISVTLPARTVVQLKLEELLSSATATQGQHFKLVLDEDVLHQGRILIPRGTPAVGTVLNVERSGQMGAGSLLSIKIEYLEIGAQRVRLHSTLSSADKSQERKAAWINAAFVPMGIFVQGKDIEVASGTLISAYTKDTVEIIVAEPATTAATPPTPVPE
jgi:hypothetical protein